MGRSGQAAPTCNVGMQSAPSTSHRSGRAVGPTAGAACRIAENAAIVVRVLDHQDALTHAPSAVRPCARMRTGAGELRRQGWAQSCVAEPVQSQSLSSGNRRGTGELRTSQWP
jgi:hypothetical protein